MRCEFREQPPPLFTPRLVDADKLRDSIIESFYGGVGVEIALYPSLADALGVLSERLGGLYRASSLPSLVDRVISGRGKVPVFSNPTPTGEALTCSRVCEYDTVVVYEGGRVYYPAESLVLCDCRVYSVGTLRDYGIDSSIAWVAGIDGGLRTSLLPGALDLPRYAGIVRRIRSRGVAAVSLSGRPSRIGPFAAFFKKKPRITGEVVSASRYGLSEMWAVSLFMEPGCYLGVGSWR